MKHFIIYMIVAMAWFAIIYYAYHVSGFEMAVIFGMALILVSITFPPKDFLKFRDNPKQPAENEPEGFWPMTGS